MKRPAMSPASFICKTLPIKAGLSRCGNVAAEDAELTGGFADFGESAVQVGGIFCFKINKELIPPGPAMDGAALDLEQIHTVLGEWLKRSEERTRAVREPHGEGSLAGFLRDPGCGIPLRHKQNEASKVFRIVL